MFYNGGIIPTCNQCHLSYPNLATLDNHIRTEHGIFSVQNSNPVKQNSDVLVNVVNHNTNDGKPNDQLEIVINNEGKFQCPYCQVSTKQRYDLKVHMNKHTGTYRCDLCEVNLTKPSLLEKHKQGPIHLKKVSESRLGQNIPIRPDTPNDSINGLLDQNISVNGQRFSMKSLLDIRPNQSSQSVPKQETTIQNRVHSENPATIQPISANNQMFLYQTRTPTTMHSTPPSLFDKIQQFQQQSTPIDIMPNQNQQQYDFVNRENKSMNLAGVGVLDKEYKCDECRMNYSSIDVLKKHKICHTDKYQCPTCKLGFTGSRSLDRHLNDKDNCERLLVKRGAKNDGPSDILQDALNTAFSIDQSINNQNDSLKVESKVGSEVIEIEDESPLTIDESSFPQILKCEFCPFLTKKEVMLHRHRTGHIGSFKCGKCGKGFSRQPNLEPHLEKCNGRPWLSKEMWVETDSARKTIEPKETENSHVVVKSQPSTHGFNCDLCLYLAPSEIMLQRHQVGHTGLLKCLKCSKGFSKGFSREIHQANCDKSNWLLKLSPSSQLPVALTISIDEDNSNSVQVGGYQSKTVKQESEQNRRNQKFEQYMMQVQNPDRDVQNLEQINIYKSENILGKVLVKQKKLKNSRLRISNPPKSPVTKTAFRSGKKNYEKYWCLSCQAWVPGGKASVSNHLRNIHDYEDCQIVMITNTGMLKVDKDDFLPEGKKIKIEDSPSKLEDHSPRKVAFIPQSKEIKIFSRSVSPKLEDSGIDMENSICSVSSNDDSSFSDSHSFLGLALVEKGPNLKTIFKEVPVVKEVRVVKEVPVVKEEPVVKKKTVVKEELVLKDEIIVKEELLVKEEPVFKKEPVVQEEPVTEAEIVEKNEPVVETVQMDEEDPIINEEASELSMEGSPIGGKSYEDVHLKKFLDIEVKYLSVTSDSESSVGDESSILSSEEIREPECLRDEEYSYNQFSIFSYDLVPEHKQKFFQEQLDMDLSTESLPEVPHSLLCHCVQCKPCLSVCCENGPVRAGLCCNPTTLGSCLQPYTPRCFAPCCHHSVELKQEFHINGNYVEMKDPLLTLVNPLQFLALELEAEELPSKLKSFGLKNNAETGLLSEIQKSYENSESNCNNEVDEQYLFPFDIPVEEGETCQSLLDTESEESLNIVENNNIEAENKDNNDNNALAKMIEDYKKFDLFMEDFETHPLDDEMKVVRKYVLESVKTFPDPQFLIGKQCEQCFEEEGKKTWFKVKILSIVMENGLDTLFSVKYEDSDEIETYRLFYDLLSDFLKVPGFNSVDVAFGPALSSKLSQRSDYSSESDYIEDEDELVEEDSNDKSMTESEKLEQEFLDIEYEDDSDDDEDEDISSDSLKEIKYEVGIVFADGSKEEKKTREFKNEEERKTFISITEDEKHAKENELEESLTVSVIAVTSTNVTNELTNDENEPLINDNKSSEWSSDPTLPTGWSKKESARAKISRKDILYLSPEGMQFRSKTIVIEHLKKSGATKQGKIAKDDEVSWGFESFEHELCETQMMNLGEESDDNEDVYFVLNRKSSSCEAILSSSNVKPAITTEETNKEDIESEKIKDEIPAIEEHKKIISIKKNEEPIIGNIVTEEMSIDEEQIKVETMKNSFGKYRKKKISVVKLGKRLIDQIEDDKRKITEILSVKIPIIERPLKKLKLSKEKSCYSCPGCSITSSVQEDLLEHIGKVHLWESVVDLVDDSSPYLCPLCTTGQCSFLHRTRKLIAEHIIRTKDQNHRDIIISLAKSMYIHWPGENQWKIEEKGYGEGHVSKKEKKPRKNIQQFKFHSNQTGGKCENFKLKSCSDIFRVGTFVAERIDLISDMELGNEKDDKEDICFKISNKFKLKHKSKPAPPTQEQLEKLQWLLKKKEEYAARVKLVQELKKKKLSNFNAGNLVKVE